MDFIFDQMVERYINKFNNNPNKPLNPVTMIIVCSGCPNSLETNRVMPILVLQNKIANNPNMFGSLVDFMIPIFEVSHHHSIASQNTSIPH